MSIHPSVWVVLGLAVVAGQGELALLAGLSLALHELSHVVAAEAVGLEVTELRVYPTGAAADLRGLLSARPSAEALVALAGPVQSLALAGLAFFAARVLPAAGEAERTAVLNLALGLANLLPAYPLDGGRVLRAFLLTRVSYREATRTALAVARLVAGVVAAGAVFAWLLGTPTPGPLVFAASLLLAAQAEAEVVFLPVAEGALRRREILAGRGALRVERLAARGDLRLRELLRHFFPRRWHEVVVLDPSLRRLGEVGEEALQKALREGDLDERLEAFLPEER